MQKVFAADPTHEMLERALVDDLWDVVRVGFNLLNLARAPLPERDRARVIELFRGVEHVSGH